MLQADVCCWQIPLTVLGTLGVINWETFSLCSGLSAIPGTKTGYTEGDLQRLWTPGSLLTPETYFPAARGHSLYVPEAHGVSIDDPWPKFLRQRYTAVILIIGKKKEQSEHKALYQKSHHMQAVPQLAHQLHPTSMVLYNLRNVADADPDTKAPFTAFSARN